MIPLFKVHVPPREHLMPELEKVIYSGYITQGARVQEFEESLSAEWGVPNVLTVNSGTSALQLALRLANVRGGNVVTTPMTCAATVLPVLAEGARPLWADVNPDSGNIDPDDVNLKVNRDTKAILAVHWGGQPCDMTRLLSIGSHFNIPVIIDAAHALGAEWDNQSIAGQADFTCYSLQAIKHITTGDGGILVVKNTDDYARGKRLRWFGLDRTASSGDARVDSDIPEWGYKFHMNDIAATMGLAQLHYLDYIVGRHRANAAYYDSHLSAYAPRQACLPEADGAWWLYTLLWEDSGTRRRFMGYMKAQDIQVSRVHARLDSLTCFRTYNGATLPGVTSFFDREACIPVHWGLSAGELEIITGAVNNFCAGV